MESFDRPYDLIGVLYETSVRPERLFDLIDQWDARIAQDNPGFAVRAAGLTDVEFVRHVERALAILDEVSGLEYRRLDDLLAGMPTASMVLTDTGVIVAANAAARADFGVFPGGSIRLMPLAVADLTDFADRVARIAIGQQLRDDIVRLRPERSRPALMHLRTLNAARGANHALAVSSEHVWSAEARRVLSRAFALTGAEISVVRQLTAGDAVADISRATGRTEGTVRSQLHSILTKTGVRTQGELIRLSTMLLRTVAFDPDRVRPAHFTDAPARDRRPRHIRLADGRKLAVLEYGDPAGRPVLCLQSAMGFHHPSRCAERELFRRRLRLVVPIRAGYGTSDLAPLSSDIFEVAVADIIEILSQTAVAPCPVIAMEYSICHALMLAKSAPQVVRAIVGVGCMFPILNMEQFRRLHAVGRAFAISVRFAPHMLRFFVRATLARVLRNGIDEFIHEMFRETPADARAFADREISEAIIAGYTFLHAARANSQAAFCAEAIRFQQAWPAGFGDVTCPVTLLHGEQDGNVSYETALDYCAAYPNWRYVGYPDEGQLVGFTRWNNLLDAIEGALLANAPAPTASLTS